MQRFINRSEGFPRTPISPVRAIVEKDLFLSARSSFFFLSSSSSLTQNRASNVGFL